MMFSVLNSAILAFMIQACSVDAAGLVDSNKKQSTRNASHKTRHHPRGGAFHHVNLGATDVAHSADGGIAQLGNPGFETRIIGGTPSQKGEFPFFVDLGGCGASLITPRVVLSAGTEIASSFCQFSFR